MPLLLLLTPRRNENKSNCIFSLMFFKNWIVFHFISRSLSLSFHASHSPSRSFWTALVRSGFLDPLPPPSWPAPPSEPELPKSRALYCDTSSSSLSVFSAPPPRRAALVRTGFGGLCCLGLGSSAFCCCRWGLDRAPWLLRERAWAAVWRALGQKQQHRLLPLPFSSSAALVLLLDRRRPPLHPPPRQRAASSAPAASSLETPSRSAAPCAPSY